MIFFHLSGLVDIVGWVLVIVGVSMYPWNTRISERLRAQVDPKSCESFGKKIIVPLDLCPLEVKLL